MKLPFGKYKGKTTTWIKENDPSYYGWLELNVKDLELKYGPKKKKKEIVLKTDEPVINFNWNDNFIWNENWPKDINEKLYIWFKTPWYKLKLNYENNK